MLQVLRTNLGVQVWLGIFAIAALVLVINAFLMRRAGLSLKPIAWFAFASLPEIVHRDPNADLPTIRHRRRTRGWRRGDQRDSPTSTGTQRHLVRAGYLNANIGYRLL